MATLKTNPMCTGILKTKMELAGGKALNLNLDLTHIPPGPDLNHRQHLILTEIPILACRLGALFLRLAHDLRIRTHLINPNTQITTQILWMKM